LSNILFDFRRKRIRRRVLVEVVRDAARNWHDQANRGTLFNPAYAIRKVLDETPPRFPLCQGSPSLAAGSGCSRVLDSFTFFAHNIDIGRAQFYVSDRPPNHLLKVLERAGLGDVAKGQMTSQRGFAWVTKSSAIDNVRDVTSREQVADRLRDALGLSHLAGDDDLVEVRYPIAPAGLDLRPPTFMEGGPALVFRCDTGADQWGRTLDLSDSGPGFPEAVHRSIPFSAEFSIRYLGNLNSSPPSVHWDQVYGDHPEAWKGCLYEEAT
jgi:hypothetical protein